MPILDVTVVVPGAARLPSDLAASLVDALAPVLDAAPGQAWLRLHALAATDYAENAGPLADEELPVFVTVLHARWPAADVLDRQVAALARLVADMLGRSPLRVHVEVAPPGAGRMAFGGRPL